MHLDVEGIEARYVRAGNGPALVLVHGVSLGSALESFEPVLEPLSQEGFTVFAYDQPGFGRTANPPDYSPGFRRAFILAFMRASGLEQAHLVGHSEAGGLVTRLASAGEQAVRSVVAIDPGGLLPELGPSQRTPPFEHEPSLEDTRRLMVSQLATERLVTDERVRFRYELSIGENFEAYLRRAGAAKEAGARAREPALSPEGLAELPVPIRLIYGTPSGGEGSIPSLVERYSFLDLHVLSPAGHLVHWDASEEVVKLISAHAHGAESRRTSSR